MGRRWTCTRRGRRSRAAVSAAVMALALGGCGERGEPQAEPAEAAAGLEIREPLAQLAPGGTGAVYLTVVNSGDGGDRLMAVETDAADAAEIHETVREGDVMRMVGHPDGLEIPPHGTVELAPGGKHVMLIEPRPGPADTIRLGLRFEKAGVLEVDVPVKSHPPQNPHPDPLPPHHALPSGEGATALPRPPAAGGRGAGAGAPLPGWVRWVGGRGDGGEGV